MSSQVHGNQEAEKPHINDVMIQFATLERAHLAIMKAAGATYAALASNVIVFGSAKLEKLGDLADSLQELEEEASGMLHDARAAIEQTMGDDPYDRAAAGAMLLNELHHRASSAAADTKSCAALFLIAGTLSPELASFHPLSTVSARLGAAADAMEKLQTCLVIGGPYQLVDTTEQEAEDSSAAS